MISFDPPCAGEPAVGKRLPSLQRRAEAVGAIKPERSWAHAPISVFDLRLELSSFLFIQIVALIK
jgi:hypothetical protein